MWLLKSVFLNARGLDVGIGSVGMVIASYLLITLLLILAQQYLFARTFNYSWNQSTLGPVSFRVDLKTKELAWVLAPVDMDAFEAAAVPEEGAVGDSAADFFDWDIGW